MSLFKDVEFMGDLDLQAPLGPEVAPKGDYDCKVLEAMEHVSKAGNTSFKVVFQVADGKFKDVTEYFNLWSDKEDYKNIATQRWTKLLKAIGFKEQIEKEDELIGKKVQIALDKVEEDWLDQEGQKRTSYRNKILTFKQLENLASSDADKNPPPPF